MDRAQERIREQMALIQAEKACREAKMEEMCAAEARYIEERRAADARYAEELRVLHEASQLRVRRVRARNFI